MLTKMQMLYKECKMCRIQINGNYNPKAKHVIFCTCGEKLEQVVYLIIIIIIIICGLICGAQGALLPLLIRLINHS